MCFEGKHLPRFAISEYAQKRPETHDLRVFMVIVDPLVLTQVIRDFSFSSQNIKKTVLSQFFDSEEKQNGF